MTLQESLILSGPKSTHMRAQAHTCTHVHTCACTHKYVHTHIHTLSPAYRRLNAQHSPLKMPPFQLQASRKQSPPGLLPLVWSPYHSDLCPPLHVSPLRPSGMHLVLLTCASFRALLLSRVSWASSLRACGPVHTKGHDWSAGTSARPHVPPAAQHRDPQGRGRLDPRQNPLHSVQSWLLGA